MNDWYEIINPSDQCYISAADPLAAKVSIMLLSRGAYALTDKDGETVLPMVRFSGYKEWLDSEGISNLQGYVDKHYGDMAKALRTVTYGSLAEVKKQQEEIAKIEDPIKREEFIAYHEDARRTSMSQIVIAARLFAKQLDEHGEEEAQS